jgi:hypothetical protein
MNKIFDKKFKVRIVKNYETTTNKFYLIQYAYYRFIPNWTKIYDNYHIITPINRRYYGCDYIYLEARYTKKEAEEMIKTLISVDDIIKIHNNLLEKINLAL